jgi:hypothetical protein
MKALLALLFAAAAFAQPVTILCGSPSDQYFSAGSVAWTMPATNPAPIQFLRYSPTFSYNIPLANGLYNISIVMAEPNVTAAGQRVFTVAAQGQVSAPVDLFVLTRGDNIAYTLPMLALVGAGSLHLQFAATAGNAVVSEIVVSPAQCLIYQTAQTVTTGVLSFGIALAGSTNYPPAALQWTLNYPPAAGPLTVTVGPAATAASKTVTCVAGAPGSTICILVGSGNAGPISDGVVAQVSAPGTASVAVTLTGIIAAAPAGTALPVTGSGLTGVAPSTLAPNTLAIGPLPDGTYMPVMVVTAGTVVAATPAPPGTLSPAIAPINLADPSGTYLAVWNPRP